mmetsp:Transcript_18516/g.42571  ORF Transcript_18516/g.42571 Transcript_18516/m.42571 type:complete len:81 (+) Transcript_18516:280-522(+)
MTTELSIRRSITHSVLVMTTRISLFFQKIFGFGCFLSEKIMDGWIDDKDNQNGNGKAKTKTLYSSCWWVGVAAVFICWFV